MLGNSFVIEMFRRHRELLSPTTTLLISLAVADLGMAVFAMPFPSLSSFADGWLFEDAGCQFHGFVGIFFGLASIGNLAVISVDRYLVICRRDLLWSYRQYGGLIAVAWFNALFWALVPIFGWSSYSLDPNGTACTINWMDNDGGYISFVCCVFVVCFVVPIGVMCFDYYAVYRKMRKAGYSHNTSGISNIAAANEDDAGDLKDGNAYPVFDWSEAKYVTRMCIALVIIFFISWSPYATIFLWAAFGDPTNVPIKLNGVAEAFSKASAFLNPAVYVIMNPRYHGYIKKMLGCKTTNQQTSASLNSDRVRRRVELFSNKQQTLEV
ncbi:visual pigment-like receptor peropsin [Ptychodera flava]|uniref:visual pigment-like receptor peropsin n=1 Tax=Ptychodera flava TaxID=63121 RepID=UPI003969C3E5